MKKPFSNKSYYPFLAFIIFAASFLIVQLIISPSPSDITNDNILGFFKNYSKYFGIGLGLISMIIAYIFILIKKIVKLGRLKTLNPIVLLLSFTPWLIFGIQLVYFENKYTNLSKAIIYFTSEPLLYASIITMSLATLWFLYELLNAFRGRAWLLSIILAPTILLNSCIGEIEGVICGVLPDSDHCFQDAAVQQGNPEACKKISGKDFADMGSNPPKDKCYLLIAENTGNLDSCDSIEGGMMSYTKEECYSSVAEKFENPLACDKMTEQARENCINILRTKIDAVKVIDIENQLETLKEALAEDPEDANLKNQFGELEKKRDAMLAILSEEEKKNYERNTEPINKLVIGDFATGKLDSETKETLIKLNEKLKEQGVPFTKESYEKYRDYLVYVRDPKNDIENMDDAELAKDKWKDKLGNAFDKVKFWKSNKTDEENKYDEQLRFYERMLNRSKAISENISEYEQEINEDLETLGKGLGEYGAGKAKDIVIKDIFGKAVGKANSVTTAVLGEAIDTVKQEAKSMEFRGLVRAYNLGMQEEITKHDGDIEKAHAEVVKKMGQNPYEYEDKSTFAKYGNILENPDCNGSNPHCIEKDVFWKAMKKSYKYQNQ